MIFEPINAVNFSIPGTASPVVSANDLTSPLQNDLASKPDNARVNGDELSTSRAVCHLGLHPWSSGDDEDLPLGCTLGWASIATMRQARSRTKGCCREIQSASIANRSSSVAPDGCLLRERIAVPIVAGMLRPVILVPLWMTTQMDPEQLLIILAHEMAHIRRFDLLVNLMQRLLETVLFFHPAVWYVSSQLSFERENCCDDAVVKAGYESLQYASTLIRLAELCASNHRQIPKTMPAALAASGSSGSQLKRRIMRLLGSEQRLRLTRIDSVAARRGGLIFGNDHGNVASGHRCFSSQAACDVAG